MEHIEELKQLIELHIRTQDPGGGRLLEVLGRIRRDSGESPGGWVYEWVAQGEVLEKAGSLLDAIQCYNFARFPFVADDFRADAHKRSLRAFEKWVARDARGIRRLEAAWRGHRIPFWFADGGGAKKPLLLVLGGIVSPKEQWHKFLLAGRLLGCNVVVTEFPGVGENPVPYDGASHGFLGAILDRVSGLADSRNTFVVGMSFGGHLAMRLASEDRRVQGITTLGAPVHYFFLDRYWWPRVPGTTHRTLAHVCRKAPEELPDFLAGLAISIEEARRIQAPVHYVCSLRDEIVPAMETVFLKKSIGRLEVVEFDDIHGSPNHMPEIRKYLPLSVLRQRRKAMSVPGIILKALLGVESMKRKRRTAVAVTAGIGRQAA